MRATKSGIGFLLGALTLALLPSCSRSKGSEAPSATLAQSAEAQQAFQTIRHRWLLAGDNERVALEPALQEFRARFPGDPKTRLCNVYLAWIALERGDLETAEALTRQVRSGAAGTTQDLADLVAGAALTRQGKPEPALDLLTPLVGKLIDHNAQSMLREQLVDATVLASRWFEALAYMDDWLRSAEEHELSAVRDRIDRLLGNFPQDSLELALRTMRDTKGRAGYGEAIRLAVTRKLSQWALQNSDVRLAQIVLESQGAMEVLGDAGTPLAQLATSGGTAPRIVDATVGLVLPPDNAVLRARAALTVAGVLEAFGPESSTVEADGGGGIAPKDSPALLTRDQKDKSAPRAPFDELAHTGAALVIAGFDAESATAASRYAESESLPVLLLTAPSEAIAGARFTFVVGEAESDLAQGLSKAASGDGRKVARVGGVAPTQNELDFWSSCEAVAAVAGESRFPLGRWRRAGVNALAIGGPVPCAQDLFAELRQARYEPAIVVGPEALGVDIPAKYKGAVVQAKVGSLTGAQDDPALKAWIQAHGSRPGWYEALGRDAAQLARAAVAVLPKGTVVDAKQVIARRIQVQQTLGTAQVSLWSTQEKGFAGGRKLARQITY